jgi:small subunit ribosomal protein S3
VGQKTNPIGLRLGIIKDWQSRWFDKKNFGLILCEDFKMKKYIKDKLLFAGIGQVVIERVTDKIRVNIHTARPGIIIGKKGSDIEKLKEELQDIVGDEKRVFINIIEINNPAANAQLVAENIAQQIPRRVSYKRAMKKAVQLAMNSGVEGIKVACSGRLGGNEIARSEWYREGRVPLHTLRADIDYGFTEAKTTYGIIGVKVWIFKGEVLPGEGNKDVNAQKSKVSKSPKR